MIIYASIGNSDDKLSQHDWHRYAMSFIAAIRQATIHIHGEWASLPVAPFQNACMCFEIDADGAILLKHTLSEIRDEYGQDSIAWAVAETEFI